MLPAGHRLRRRHDFSVAVRSGVRAGRPTLVAHLHRATTTQSRATVGPDPATPRPAQAGFVVSGAVGGAVTRNLVRRRLRAAVAERLAALPADSVLVIRAQPPAAVASYADLVDDLDRALARLGVHVGAVTPAGTDRVRLR